MAKRKQNPPGDPCVRCNPSGIVPKPEDEVYFGHVGPDGHCKSCGK